MATTGSVSTTGAAGGAQAGAGARGTSGGSGFGTGSGSGAAAADAPRHRPGRRRRPELAAFLRGRRARVSPRDVGMAPGLRRRTPGLRREEVAELSGVGVTWYTWLEQGRPINASPQVLDAVARTLRLDGTEREHLYRLAEVAYDEHGRAAPWPDSITDDSVADEVQGIIDDLHPRIAAVYDALYDVLATNAAYRAVFQAGERPFAPGSGVRGHGRDGERAGGGHPSGERPNVLRTMFLDDGGGVRLVHPDKELSLLVATLRSAYGRHVGEGPWERLVHGMSAQSTLFAEIWQRGDVVPPGSRLKGFRQPRVGEIYLRSLSLNINSMPECRIVTYTPADAESARRVALLVNAARAA